MSNPIFDAAYREQASENLETLAKLLAGFFHKLLRCGFTRGEALEIVLTQQRGIIQASTASEVMRKLGNAMEDGQ